ncbi:TadE/TadG family type IV pilus assembly protein [Roseibium sp. FZY0029]|uniref:TadE/TadG family type IV pilus assembly protein n=1 Tax=Roseibium sp. FZY0029 TaxID=3116647 RepID=UPI002EA5689B|nr:TadE/TadG family type IV pilus assembly protein [Roseibium sp. FZY0029]
MNPGTKTRRHFPQRRRFLTGLRSIGADKRAVTAIEFAMILPFMLILLIGMEEVTGTLDHDRKVSRIANSVADLVAQGQTLTPADLKAMLDIGGKIIDPYPDTDLETIVASVTFDDEGTPAVDWSYSSKGGAAWPKGSKPPIELPETVAVPNSSIVLAQANLKYVPTFSGMFTTYFARESSIDLSDSYYLRPRLTDTVKCPAC